jgi:thiol:disulfide interchange protein DsbD
MEKLKYFLGLSLLATAIWLYDVFVSLVNFEVISWRLNLLFALWFFAFFFAQKISRRKIAQFIVFSIPLILTVVAIQNLELKPTSTATVAAANTKAGLWSPWTEEKMSGEKDKPVFVDFTAEWCITCKVNKKLVLETDGFERLRSQYDFISMRADWTKRDDNITDFLKRHGAVSVPAYFIQKPGGKLISLGETISLGEIEEALK